MGIFDKLTERVGDFIDEVMIPEEVHMKLERAQQDIQKGYYDQALDILHRVDRIRPGLSKTAHLMGQCHFHRGAPQEAARAFRRAIEIKEDASHHFWAGLCMEQLHEWPAAQAHLRQALSIGERTSFDFDVYFALGRVQLNMGRADKAIKELRKALKLMPSHPEASITLAEALLSRSQAEDAQQVIDEVNEQIEGAKAWLTVAQTAQQLNQPNRALEAYELATQDGSAQPEHKRIAHIQAALLCLELRQLPAAKLHLKAARLLTQGELGNDIHLLEGMLAIEQDRAEDATTHLQTILERDPTHGQALVLLADLLRDAQQIEQAEHLYKRALEADHQQQPARAMLGLGHCQLKAQDYTGASQWAAQGIKSTHDPSVRAQLHHLAASVALAQGDPARTLVEAQQAQGFNPTLDLQTLTDAALTQLKPRWGNLPEDIKDPVSLQFVLTSLRNYIASDVRLVDFLPTVQDMLDTLNAPLSIAIVGEFNAGKSTLINALIGEEILPMGVLPTTAHTGIIQYGPRQTARVHYIDDRVEEVPFDQAKRLMKTNAQEIDHLDYLYPHPELRAVNFWDTPGFNALEARHEVVAQKALETAEAILWVLDANQVLSQTEFDRIESVPQGNQRLLVLINKVDRLGPKGFRDDAVAELVDYVEEFASEHIAGVFPLSGLQALQYRQQTAQMDEHEKPEDDSGMVEFRQHLHSAIVERAGHIKTLEGQRHLTRLVVTLSAFQHGLLLRYRRLTDDIHETQRWVHQTQKHHANQRAQDELIKIEDRMDFMLRSVVQEIQEALTPKSTWINTRMVISDEDRDFITTLLIERFDSLLDNSLERVFTDVFSLESELAQKLGPILQDLSLQDARSIAQRLEGFRDEVRVMRLLLEERVYGRIKAQANGQISAAGTQALKAITISADKIRWKGILRSLLPELRPHFKETLEQWYVDFFTAANKLFERVEHDMTLLALEAQHRYDIAPIEALCGLARFDDEETQG